MTPAAESSPRTRTTSKGRVPAYLSHHKCATMWVNGILERLCRESGLRFRSFDGPEQFGGDLAGHLARHPVDLVSYINARWEQVERVDGLVGVHVIRDPRDILVSAYFSHLRTHRTDGWPELVEHRERLRELDKADGLLLEIEFSADVFEALAGWDYGSDRMLELTFEEVTSRPYESFLQILEYLGLLQDGAFGLRRKLAYDLRGLWNQAVAGRGPAEWLAWPRSGVPAERLLGVVHQNRFARKTGGRAPGEEDRGSHYRKGEPGDWENHLSERHLRALADRFPGLLRRTGYARGQPRGGEG